MMKEKIIDRYLANTGDDGRYGRGFEVDFRDALIGEISRIHPLGIADVTVKTGVTVECKSGCGWLVNPDFDSEDEAKEFFDNSYKPMTKASHIAYLPKWTKDNTYDAIIIPQRKFLAILDKYGLIRTKSKKDGLGERKWGIAIQSYIPTPTFRASQSRFDALLLDFADNGETIEEFAERMFR